MARLSPQSQGMDEIVRLMRAAADGELDAAAAETAITAHLPDGVCNGYWLGQPGMDWQPEAARLFT